MRVHMGNTMNLPVEMTESLIPVRFNEYSLVEDSGGAGLHLGGLGVRKSFTALADGLEASILGERTTSAALGAVGGEAGACASFAIVRADGARVVLGAKSGPHRMDKGDRLDMVTAGGGGWGASE